jgi:hypothetical protein
MKNANTLLSACFAMTFGILLVIVGKDILDNTGDSYETALSFTMSASMLLYAGYMLIGFSIIGFFVSVIKD